MADSVTASEAARALGSIRTPRKSEASRKNIARGRNLDGAPRKNPLGLVCTCGAGTETVVGENHKTTCARGRLLWQRSRTAEKAREQGKENADDESATE